MAEAVLCGEKSTHSVSFLRSLAAPEPGAAPCFSCVRFAMSKPAPLRVLAMSVKRSPKRLKYSAPRFTKAPELHSEFHKHGGPEFAGPSASSTSTKTTKTKKSSDLKYDVLGWVILAVGIVAWVGFAKSHVPPPPPAR